jgi:hypothetical protein
MKISIHKFILVIGLLAFYSNTTFASKSKDVIELESNEKAISERKAILILPGIGINKKGIKKQVAFFKDKGYDLFIPNYMDKDSYQKTLDYLSNFYYNQKLDKYKEVKVFAYILGSWVINDFITKHLPKNITSIVYDRSPLQERAPRLVVEKKPRIVRLVLGEIVEEFSLIPYSGIENTDSIKIGIIVESKATRLVRFYKKTVLSYGEIDWSNLDFNQPHEDLIYTRLNHKEMYSSFDEIGDDILHFFANGKFLDSARRTNYEWDPFKKYKKSNK